MEIHETTTTTRVKDREQLFEAIYIAVFPNVARFVSSRNGTFDDAKDIFQDALVIYYEKSGEADAEVIVSAEAYIMGIAKHLWSRRAKQGYKLTLTHVEENIAASEDNTINTGRLLHLLETTGKKCMDLLRSFYYHEQPAMEIARSMKYSSKHSVAVQKYKCLEQIRDTVKEKSISYETFTN